MIRSFITEYLPQQRCYSTNTVESYRNTLNLYISYLHDSCSKTISEIDFDDFNTETIQSFISWLINERNYKSSSVNQRLAALCSFAKYAGMRDCTKIALSQEMNMIPKRKDIKKPIEFLSETALQALLAQPNPKKHIGLRDQFFMILMYDTAARCSELLNLRLCDLKLSSKYPMVYLSGKGNKRRAVPLLSKTVEHCKVYLNEFHPHECLDSKKLLFYTQSSHGRNQMSYDAVSMFIKKYGAKAKMVCSEMPDRLHPHQMRHTRAIHLYRSGMPLALLAEFLGHSSVQTTQIYAYADTEMKRAALEKASHLTNLTPKAIPMWQDNEDLILSLSGLK